MLQRTQNLIFLKSKILEQDLIRSTTLKMNRLFWRLEKFKKVIKNMKLFYVKTWVNYLKANFVFKKNEVHK